MIAVLTADIINSAAYDTATWMKVLKSTLSQWGTSPQDWEIYRGDEFQLRTAPGRALQLAIEIKARIKCIKNLDVRIAIGLGEESFRGNGVSECNGTAYQRSGRTLEQLKVQKKNLGIDTGNPDTNQTLNIILDLASDFMNSWSTVSAEIVAFSLANPGITQSAMAEQLQIRQSAVSQRQKRARYSLVQEVLNYYLKLIKEIDT